MKTPRILAATIAALAASTFTTEAATLTWGGAQSIAGDSDVSTNGTRVMAYTFGDLNVAATTVNGVTFDPFALRTNGRDQLSYTVGNATFGTPDDIGPAGTSTSTWQTLSSSYASLLTSAAGLAGDRNYQLTLSGLVVGQKYEFQVWSSNSNRSSDFPFSYPFTIDGNELYPGDNGTDGGGPGVNTPPTPGQYLIGSFIADGTMQDFSMYSSEVNGYVNGFQLRALAAAPPPPSPVPEPGSALVGMLVLGLCGLGSARRRRAV